MNEPCTPPSLPLHVRHGFVAFAVSGERWPTDTNGDAKGLRRIEAGEMDWECAVDCSGYERRQSLTD